MTPCLQTETAEGSGNCFAACIASILNLPLEAVPNFRKIQEDEGRCMIMAADNWLRENHGMRFIGIEMYKSKVAEGESRYQTSQVLMNRCFFMNEDEYVILSGESPRKNADGSTKYHSVVGRADCWGFEIVHDPHPDGGGLVGEPYGVKWIVPVRKENAELQ